MNLGRLHRGIWIYFFQQIDKKYNGTCANNSISKYEHVHVYL